jgi:hypothetical protein
MSLPLRIFVVIIVVTLLIALTHKAWAYDLEEGLGVVCDTAAQIEQFASLDAKPESIQTVNAGKTVCAKVNIRYIEGRKLSRIRMSERTVEVVEILVVEVNICGHCGAITPEVQHTLFQIKEVPA